MPLEMIIFLGSTSTKLTDSELSGRIVRLSQPETISKNFF